LGRVQYRHAGQGAPGQATHVLLHGIGSGSASWVAQLQAASAAPLSVLAWDAPGYGGSAPVEPAQPVATDYAQRVWAWLDTLGVTQPVTLVGHSLGAIMAASAARMAPHRVQRLVLLAPARGYANAAPAEREKKLQDRLHNLLQLAPACGGFARPPA
jgi:pimeloyl-ACP methyl ester carboxylesterase